VATLADWRIMAKEYSCVWRLEEESRKVILKPVLNNENFQARKEEENFTHKLYAPL
jgi:hypothetical protein